MRLPSKDSVRKTTSKTVRRVASDIGDSARQKKLSSLRRGVGSDESMNDIARKLYDSIIVTDKKQRRMKSKTLWQEHYGVKRRTIQKIAEVSESLTQMGISIIVKDADFGHEDKDDWLTLVVDPSPVGRSGTDFRAAGSEPASSSTTGKAPEATSTWPGAVELPADNTSITPAPPVPAHSLIEQQPPTLMDGPLQVSVGRTRLATSRRPRTKRGWAALGCGGLLGVCAICTWLGSLLPPAPATVVPNQPATERSSTKSESDQGVAEPVMLVATDAIPTSTLPPVTIAPATETSIPPSVTPVPPTDTPLPPTSTSVPPTPAPPIDRDARATLRCDDFPNYETMVAWRRYWTARGVTNPGQLDGDGDGIACEDGEGGRPAPPPPPAAPAQNFSGAVAPQQELPAPAPRNCCKVCNPGRSKACGDSCISLSYTCRKGAGCACDG